MRDIEVILERHEQQIKTLEREMSDMKEVQAEIRTMNETLVTLATELKHNMGVIQPELDNNRFRK